MKNTDFLPEHYEEIIRYLRDGGVAILPTDTIPGFSADPENSNAVHQISALKNRPLDSPFLLLVPDFLTAERLCIFSEKARNLVNRFWPGPLTLLLKRKNGVFSGFFSESQRTRLAYSWR
jgi:L-threonylcarbamoyladenylate synthase